MVTDYLEKSGLQTYLDQQGFNLVGYGCTTCIGNSGPLPDFISKAIEDKDLVACSVLSGNRNFEGRVNPHVKANFLASPPLVVAYALAGSLNIDLSKDAIGENDKGEKVYLKDIWPSSDEIKEMMNMAVTREMFMSRYSSVFDGDANWQAIKTSSGKTYTWQENSTYVKRPSFFDSKESISGFKLESGRILALLGDSVTTDHISPAGSIAKGGPAAQYLESKGVKLRDFNSFGSRRGNHEVMMRGTFANIRIRNEMLPGVEGGETKHVPSGKQMSIFDAAMKYAEKQTPLIVVGGKEYGTGSSRDWAAKGTKLLGVKAVLVESFERIHRSNLVGMGVLPLQFNEGFDRKSLGLTGDEEIAIQLKGSNLAPSAEFDVTFTDKSGNKKSAKATCRLDTEDEVSYFENQGILNYVLKKMA